MKKIFVDVGDIVYDKLFRCEAVVVKYQYGVGYRIRHLDSGAYEHTTGRTGFKFIREKGKAVERKSSVMKPTVIFETKAKRDYYQYGAYEGITAGATVAAYMYPDDTYLVEYGSKRFSMPGNVFRAHFRSQEEQETAEWMRRRIERERMIQQRKERDRRKEEEPQRSAWFDVLAKDDYVVGDYFLAEGTLLQMRALSTGMYEVNIKGVIKKFTAEKATELFERYDIDDYATEYPRKKGAANVKQYEVDEAMKGIMPKKEEPKMSAELYGHFSDDDGYEAAVRKLEIAAKREQELAAKVTELEKKNEVARRQAVAETYGIVTERYLWDVTISVPSSWTGRGGSHRTEVVTEGRDVCEAAMAAEAMAKGMHEKATVDSIEYKRKIGAVK